MSTEVEPPDKLKKPNTEHGHWLLHRIWERVNKREMHFMGCIVGREGIGKSHTAIKIATEIDQSFDANRVLFDVTDLLKVLHDGKHEPGNFYVLDEAGVSFGRRTWQERGQILANQALQLIRNHNLGLIFTLPRLGELDSQTQGRLQCFYEITNREKDKYVTGKWKWMDPDRSDFTGEVYKPYPVRRQNGYVVKITRFSFRPPPIVVTSAYEDRKTEFQQRMYKRTIDELDDSESESESRGVRDIYESIVEDGSIESYVSYHGHTGNPYIDADMVQLEHDLSVRDAKKVKKLLEHDDTISVDDLE